MVNIVHMFIYGKIDNYLRGVLFSHNSSSIYIQKHLSVYYILCICLSYILKENADCWRVFQFTPQRPVIFVLILILLICKKREKIKSFIAQFFTFTIYNKVTYTYYIAIHPKKKMKQHKVNNWTKIKKKPQFQTL